MIGLLVLALALGIQLLVAGYHKIPEGHVGIYYVTGKLSTTINAPGRRNGGCCDSRKFGHFWMPLSGYHVMVPYITKLVEVSTSFRTYDGGAVLFPCHCGWVE
jgi:regulator of protease activity HflC (stomatin/prohibitin superfamily)